METNNVLRGHNNFESPAYENIYQKAIEDGDEKLLEDILKVHKSVFNMYFPQYVGDYFKTMVDKFVLVE